MVGTGCVGVKRAVGPVQRAVPEQGDWTTPMHRHPVAASPPLSKTHQGSFAPVANVLRHALLAFLGRIAHSALPASA